MDCRHSWETRAYREILGLGYIDEHHCSERMKRWRELQERVLGSSNDDDTPRPYGIAFWIEGKKHA